MDVVILIVGGVCLLLSIIMFHQAWITYISYRDFDPDKTLISKDGVITDMKTGESHIQKAPHVPF